MMGEVFIGRVSNWVVIIGVVLMQVMVHLEMESAKNRMDKLEGEMLIMRDLNKEDQAIEFERRKRAVSTSRQTEDYALKDKTDKNKRKYSSFQPDSTGFRLYNAWANNTTVVQDHSQISPIHTRHSTAWTEKDENEFLEFGDSMYSDASDTSQTKNAAASWAPVSNIGYNDQNRPKRKRPKTIRLNWKRRRQDRQDKKRVLAAKMNIIVSSTTNKPPSNNGSAKPLNRHRLKSRSGRHLKKMVRPAIHLHAELNRSEGSKDAVPSDSTFRNWTPSRWAKRLKMDTKFLLEDGKLTVKSSGIYFVYAQINYLDNHDANAFQIVINSSPIFLCTTMTHKRRFSTKSNTCYTGGVTFLEHGDTLFIKDLEEHRSAVMQSSHSFFGLAQLSGM